MKLYKHKSYEKYKDSQIVKNVNKLDNVWVSQKEIKYLISNVSKCIGHVKSGICHGVRNGWEVKKLREAFPDANIIGTDISHTAKNFENIIQWDFHDCKDEWVSKFDFIYSNSFDHAYDPYKCLDAWMMCLSKNGICYIHYEFLNKHYDSADCFSASKQELKELFRTKYDIFSCKIFSSNRVIFGLKNRE